MHGLKPLYIKVYKGKPFICVLRRLFLPFGYIIPWFSLLYCVFSQ
nr:MAG TPA: hypothetical protein [Caudoviricetes sp.]